mmetsp:Transcript_66554/g.143556  ORF Transcript_66554/g.143556 Transcript_66554/m.143556 type:complete len:366 (-) Transcript_66554:543-1640(-)
MRRWVHSSRCGRRSFSSTVAPQPSWGHSAVLCPQVALCAFMPPCLQECEQPGKWHATTRWSQPSECPSMSSTLTCWPQPLWRQDMVLCWHSRLWLLRSAAGTSSSQPSSGHATGRRGHRFSCFGISRAFTFPPQPSKAQSRRRCSQPLSCSSRAPGGNSRPQPVWLQASLRCSQISLCAGRSVALSFWKQGSNGHWTRRKPQPRPCSGRSFALTSLEHPAFGQQTNLYSQTGGCASRSWLLQPGHPRFAQATSRCGHSPACVPRFLRVPSNTQPLFSHPRRRKTQLCKCASRSFALIFSAHPAFGQSTTRWWQLAMCSSKRAKVVPSQPSWGHCAGRCLQVALCSSMLEALCLSWQSGCGHFTSR